MIDVILRRGHLRDPLKKLNSLRNVSGQQHEFMQEKTAKDAIEEAAGEQRRPADLSSLKLMQELIKTRNVLIKFSLMQRVLCSTG